MEVLSLLIYSIEISRSQYDSQIVYVRIIPHSSMALDSEILQSCAGFLGTTYMSD